MQTFKIGNDTVVMMKIEQEKGFTLIELIIALGIGMVVMTAIYASMNMAQRSSSSVGRKVVTQQDARAVLDLMAMEIRMASFNPLAPSEIWEMVPTCSGVVGPCPGESAQSCKKYKGIQSATADMIHISMDLNEDSVIGCNCGPCCADYSCPDNDCKGTNEHILYYYNNNDNSIRRRVGCSATAEAILGGTGLETSVTNQAAGIPLFRYYDRNGNETTDITAVRRIGITIVAETKDKDSMTGKTRKMVYATDVLVKNHVLCQ
jgi:prepilin-type N-terminal cleavage/methylation domain-containing protein